MQKTLTENAPMILDATCSYGRRWPRHATIRMDIRPEVKPDLVGDIRHTNFPSHYFDEVYIDPPHMIRKDPYFVGKNDRRRRLNGRYSPGAFNRYGFFKSIDEWLSFLDSINIEVSRILKVDGLLHLKVTDGKDKRVTKRVDVERLTNFKVVKEKVTISRTPNSKNHVHWITMKPLEGS